MGFRTKENDPLDYIDRMNTVLVPANEHKALVVDLFAGCGGLALGFEAQGFETIGYEMNTDCCLTYSKNLRGKCIQTFLTSETEYPKAKVVIGGPPCQPFSVGGRQKGHDDARNGFPAFVSAVRKIKPEIFLFENVRGLLYRNKWYFDEVISQLEALGFIVEFKLMNAVKYEVPQNRERVIVVGHKGGFKFPSEQHFIVSAGQSLGELAYTTPPESKFLTPSMDNYIAKYEKASSCINPRDLYLNKPARTLTCRNLAGATGDMHRIKLPDGRRRRLLVREAARLQSFPDWFEFEGNTESVFNQIGNAVPPFFAYHLAGSINEYLNLHEKFQEERILMPKSKQYAIFEMKEVSMSKVRDKVFIGSKNKTFASKPKNLQILINEAAHIISELGVPLDKFTARGLERMAMAFLAVVDVKTSSQWKDAKDLNDNHSMKSRDIIDFWNQHFAENISKGSYDDVRRKDLDLLILADVIIRTKPNSARNNPSRGYALNPEYSAIVRSYGSEKWEEMAKTVLENTITLGERMAQKRDTKKVNIAIPSGAVLEFSPGEHNELQKSIIEEFLPIFGCGAELLYVGDTAKKHIIYEEKRLKELGFFELEHGELPDVVAYSPSNNWLFLIEAVHSCNPVTVARKIKIEELTKQCSAGIVFVSAFRDRKSFVEFVNEIAWETEVWIANNPEHMIHFNGDKFLGPHK